MNTTPAVTRLTLEQAEALRLRAGGATYREIGEHQGVHESTAQRRVKTGLSATLQEPADELRTLEAHRLDILFAIAARKAADGSLYAVDRCLTIMERRARLLGLDAPVRVEQHVITEDAIDAELKRLEAELAANDPDGVSHGGAAGEDPAADRASQAG